MREILFRGKRADNGEWVYGDYCGICRVGCNDGDFVYRHLIHRSNDEPLYMVDPETVGEYTGLTDRNGKKVFEGDILSDETGDTYKVCFSDGIMWAENSRFIEDICAAVHVNNINEVIGNIYDNPELLEVKK